MASEVWSHHPDDYRGQEVRRILDLLQAGECVSLIALSGMGKSNLLGFLAYRASQAKGAPTCALLDCNRLAAASAEAFYSAATRAIREMASGESPSSADPSGTTFESLASAVSDHLHASQRPLALLLDGLDDLVRTADRPFFNNLRALRDRHKFRLAYLTASRRPLTDLAPPETLREFHDLFVANQIWLQPLAEDDARWALNRYAERRRTRFRKAEVEALLRLSGRHPGLLRALAAGWEEGNEERPDSWLALPAVARECALLWDDLPQEARVAACTRPGNDATLRDSGLALGDRLFSPVFAAYVAAQAGPGLRLDRKSGEVTLGGIPLQVELTAKEHDLLAYLLDHANAICEKDDLIRAVWPEDRVFVEGIRDDSLAQLVHRLRTKVEPDPAQPRFLVTVPGRGYRLAAS